MTAAGVAMVFFVPGSLGAAITLIIKVVGGSLIAGGLTGQSFK